MKTTRSRILLVIGALSLLASSTLFAVGAAATSEEKELVEIQMYLRAFTDKDELLVEEALNEYLKKDLGLNYKIDLELINYGDYKQKLGTIVAVGEPFELAVDAQFIMLEQNIGKGGYLKLNDLIAENHYFSNEYPQYQLSGVKRTDGSIYAIPVQKDLTGDRALMFNKQYLDKYNLTLPESVSPESLEPLLKVMHENEPELTLINANNNGFFWFFENDQIFLAPTRVRVMTYASDPKKIINLWDTPEFEQYIRTMRKYYQAGYVNPDAPTLRSSTAAETGDWFVWYSHHLPYGEIQKAAQYGVDIALVKTGWMWLNTTAPLVNVIGVNSDHPEEAFKVLELTHSDPIFERLLIHGIEGKHYIKIGDAHWKYPEGITSATSTHNIRTIDWGNTFNQLLSEGIPKDRNEKFMKMNAEAPLSPLLGFLFDTTQVEAEWSAVNAVWEEYRSQLVTGSVDVDEVYPKFLQKLKDAGIDKILTEEQRQLDAFWAAKK